MYESAHALRAMNARPGISHFTIPAGTHRVVIDPPQLSEWIRGLDEEECARMRESSSLWKAWRRLQEHRKLTGHVLSVLPLPPNAISNPN